MYVKIDIESWTYLTSTYTVHVTFSKHELQEDCDVGFEVKHKTRNDN